MSAAAAMSRDSDTKNLVCIGSAVRWASYAVMNIIDKRRGDLQENQANINTILQLVMSAWKIAAATSMFEKETIVAKK